MAHADLTGDGLQELAVVSLKGVHILQVAGVLGSWDGALHTCLMEGVFLGAGESQPSGERVGCGAGGTVISI